MRIQDAYRQLPTTTDAAASRPAVADGGESTSSSGSTGTAPVKVTVSDKARALAGQASEASAAKVSALQEQVANGTFKIDPQAIANRITEGD